MIGVQVEAALRIYENRNSLALSLLATGALIVSVLEFVSAYSTLQTILVVFVAIVYTVAVWAAPHGPRAQGLYRRYRSTMSRRYRCSLLPVGLSGCASFAIAWFGVVGTGSKVLAGALGFVCLQTVAIALVYPLGRSRRSTEAIGNIQAG